MKRKVLALLTILMASSTLVGCNKSSKPANIDSQKIASGYTTTYPGSVTGALHNQGMGWITLEEQTELGKLDLGHNGDLPEIDNVGIQTCWDILEPKEGEFNWELVDETIDYWTSKGKRINFRICTDSLSLPEVSFGAPRWLNEEPYNVHYEEFPYSGSIMARVNDLTDPNYQRFFERFLNELSSRYATNPYIDTIDIRGYGMFGEWHSGHSFESMQERMFVLAYIVDKYAENFAKEGKTLFLSNSWDYQGINEDGSSAATQGNCNYEDYLAWSAFDSAMQIEYIGFRRDGMAGNGVTKYITDEKALAELIRSGKKVSNCGEFFAGFERFVNSELGMNPVEATEELMFKSRCNYSTVLGWVNSEVVNIVEAGYEEVFNRGNTKMGYRFKIDQAQFPKGVKQGDTAYILTKMSNSGVGRFTLPDHKLQLLLIDSNGKICQTYNNTDYDLRILLNGEPMNVYSSFKINDNLSSGKYTLAASIVDKNNQPSIRMAQVGGYDTKIYPIGEINVGNFDTPKAFYEVMSYEQAKSYNFKEKTHYEITFDYQPSVELSEFKFGDNNGFEVSLKAKDSKNDIVACNFQDVSKEKAVKTVAVSTNNGGKYSLDISGTGIYKDKISVGNVIVTSSTGYLEQFENNYDLLSTKSAWYCDNDNGYVTDENKLAGKDSLVISGIQPHGFSDALYSDPSLLKLEKNTSYTISFKTKGKNVGGNACYYYVKLDDGSDNGVVIGEWYDRPDEPMSTKVFTFTTTDSEDARIIFGVKNNGAYLLDDINIVKNYNGLLIKGEDVLDVNNVRTYENEKFENGYVEGFENMVLNDSTFTYGFNRWGHLTKEENEVISGSLSMSSKLDPITYENYPDSNWFEFMYSNSKYIKLERNTSYSVSFKYKLIEHIYQNTDPDLDGYAYMLARSKTFADKDCDVISFAKQDTQLNQVLTLTYEFTTGNADDYYIIMGLYGRGVLIVDDISVTKK